MRIMHPKIFYNFNIENYYDTKESINALLGSSITLARIIAVDNGSSDGSIESLKKDFDGFYFVEFIKNSTNYGFAKGMNVGIHFALEQGANYIFLVNNDAVIDESCIERLLAKAEKDHSVGLAGPRIFYYKNPQRIWHSGGYFSQFKTGVVVPVKNKLVDSCNEDPKQVTLSVFFYSDFGLIGTLVMMWMLGWFSCWIYFKCLRRKSTPLSIANIMIWSYLIITPRDTMSFWISFWFTLVISEFIAKLIEQKKYTIMYRRQRKV